MQKQEALTVVGSMFCKGAVCEVRHIEEKRGRECDKMSIVADHANPGRSELRRKETNKYIKERGRQTQNGSENEAARRPNLASKHISACLTMRRLGGEHWE